MNESSLNSCSILHASSLAIFSSTPNFINIVVWRGLAENCHKYLRKGSKAAVSGYLQMRNYETKEGQKRTVAEVVADDVEFVGSKRTDDEGYTANSDEQTNSEPVVELEPIDDGELPF